MACKRADSSADFRLPISVATETSPAHATEPPSTRHPTRVANKTDLFGFMLKLLS